jgi:hypothetical protein
MKRESSGLRVSQRREASVSLPMALTGSVIQALEHDGAIIFRITFLDPSKPGTMSGTLVRWSRTPTPARLAHLISRTEQPPTFANLSITFLSPLLISPATFTGT